MTLRDYQEVSESRFEITVPENAAKCVKSHLRDIQEFLHPDQVSYKDMLTRAVKNILIPNPHDWLHDISCRELNNLTNATTASHLDDGTVTFVVVGVGIGLDVLAEYMLYLRYLLSEDSDEIYTSHVRTNHTQGVLEIGSHYAEFLTLDDLYKDFASHNPHRMSTCKTPVTVHHKVNAYLLGKK